MTSPLQRQLLVVTGKGGVGKTTLATALGLLAAERGRRTIVVELGEHARLPALFGHSEPPVGLEIELQDGLWSMSIDPDRALLEWLQALGGRVSGRVLASSNTFQYFAAAAPGAKELVTMVKICTLTESKRGRRSGSGFELVVLDAPATGHALGLLDSPRTFGAIARVGPIVRQTDRLDELLRDATRSGYVAVAQPTEMAVTETLELEQGLQRQLARQLDLVVLNGVLPQRFTAAEMTRVERLQDNHADAPELARSALRAARATHQRARFQHNQLARLRRRDFDVARVPFQFTPAVDLDAIRAIARALQRRL